MYYNPEGEGWHIFEGQSQPDVFIQTSDFLIVIEGKRTERKPTTSTKWMMGRHQMLRHIDCAWEIRNKRNVIGFFIVEGTGEKGNIYPLRGLIMRRLLSIMTQLLQAFLTASQRNENQSHHVLLESLLGNYYVENLVSIGNNYLIL